MKCVLVWCGAVTCSLLGFGGVSARSPHQDYLPGSTIVSDAFTDK